MIISDLNYLETAANSEAVCGATGRSRNFTEVDSVKTTFDTTNKFETIIKAPANVYNISASAGAKGVAEVYNYSAYSFTKADTLSLVDYYGNSTSLSTSAALISW